MPVFRFAWLAAAALACRAAAASPTPALHPPAGRAAGDILIDATKFDRGDVRVDRSYYGRARPVILNAGKLPNIAEYDFTVARPGVYDLYVLYAAASPRPVEARLDGELMNRPAARSTTGSWMSNTAGWERAGCARLSRGRHTLALRRRWPFPHIAALLWRVAPPNRKPPLSRKDIMEQDKRLLAAGDICALLRKKDYYFLVDNQVTHCNWHQEHSDRRHPGPVRHLPGIVSLWSWPSGGGYFSIGAPVAVVEAVADGKPLPLALDADASEWRPDRVHTEYAAGSLRLKQDVCLADDTAVCRVVVAGAAPRNARLRVVVGAAAEAGAAKTECEGDTTLLLNAGRLAGVWQGVAGARAEGWALSPDGAPTRFVLAATLSRDKALVKRRLAKALADPDAMFAAASKRWADFFAHGVPKFECSDPDLAQLYYWIAYVLEGDAYRRIDHPAWPYAYVVPSKWTWRGVWPEDVSHALTGLRWFLDPSLAEDCLRTIYLKHFDPHADQKAKVHAYGLNGMAARLLFARAGDDAFLRELFPRMAAMNDFIAGKLDEDGDGLVSMFDSFFLGWDSSLRFDYGGNLVERRHFRRALEPVDANTYFCADAAWLADAAERLGDAAAAQKFRLRSQRTWNAIQKKMWDEETGFYYDLFADTDAFSKVKSCAGFFPLVAGALPRARARRLVAHLTNPEEFWRPYPLACLSNDEPAAHKAGGWTGSVALRNNWLAVEGLARNGFTEEAGELVRRTLKLLLLPGPHHVEKAYYYRPDTGRGTSPPLNVMFSTPVAGAFDFLLRRVAGVDPRIDGRVRFRPFALDPKLEWLRVSGVVCQGRRIDVTWSRAEGYQAFIDGRLAAAGRDPGAIDVTAALGAAR